jgi:mxaJ protein
MVRATRPYYVSTYVFVTRGETIASFDDARLREWRIGVPLVGDDGASTPPAHALARRGLAQNLRGYSVYGDYRETAPPARLVAAVAQNEVDVALAWGPLAGYFATRQETPLRVTPVDADRDVPMRFAIALGVRRADAALARELDAALERRRNEIDAILTAYGVPRVDAMP